MSRRRKLLVLHLAGRYPLAGVVWQAIQYVVGLTQLGHDVYYLEDSGAPPYDPVQKTTLGDYSVAAGTIDRFMRRFDLGDRWSCWDGSDRHYGMSGERVRRLYGEADALLNLCGATLLRDEHLRCPVRIYVETDPGYEQMSLANGDERSRAFLEAHTHHFTYGENLAGPDATLPGAGFRWRATRPPVVLEHWTHSFTPDAERFTTVGTLRNVGKDIVFQGERYYWSKHVNFARVQTLPSLTGKRFEIAMESTRAEDLVAAFLEQGWILTDARDRSVDLDAYRDYVHASRGEFTVAKDIYVRTQCGWFSDRSVCYLAAGKPVVTQDTGFRSFLPTGRGLFAFDDVAGGRDAIERIESDYAGSCRGAREVAVEHFASERVLARLLADADL